MADISAQLENILTAIYGEEVRGSIHDALKAMNAECSEALEAAVTSKDSAAASALSAKSFSDAAAIKADETAKSAAAAKASEGNAKNSENSAESAKADALQARDAANTARQDAQTIKADVEQLADDVLSKAVSAANSADAAAASALSAQQYSGKPSKPQDGTWWIWDADKQAYADSGISCELVGPAGNGIKDIKLTSGDHTPGTTDVYTVTLTDGTVTSIPIYNGRNGTGTGDVLGISFDLVLPFSGWTNKEITVSDSRLIASKKYKYFLGVYDSCKDQFNDCDVRPDDIVQDGFIRFTNAEDPVTDITVNLIRLELSANGESGSTGGVIFEH